MSELPEGWSVTKADVVCEKLRGVSYDKSEASREERDGYVPILRANNIDSDHLTFEDLVFVPRTRVSEKQKLQVNDVVVAMSSGSKSVVGKTAQMLGSWNGSFGAFCGVLRPTAHIDGRYFGYFFRTKEYRLKVSELSAGTNINNLKNEHFAEINFPLAPLNEQRRIVAKLEKLLSRVDAAQARLATIPRILKRFRQSVLAAACSGRLTADWRRDNVISETVGERLANIKRARLALAKTASEASRIAETLDRIDCNFDDDAPKDWLVFKAETICDFITKGTTPNTKEVTSSGDIPFLKVQHIVKNKLDFNSLPYFVSSEVHNHFLKRSKVYPRDVLMNIVGPPLNKVAIVPSDFPEWNINQALAIFRPVEGVSPEYLQLALSHEETLEHITRETRGIVGQSNISLEQCRDLKILVPPLTEQQEIVRRVESLFKTADALEARYRTAKAHVDKLTQSILARAFRGELVTTEAELARLEGRDYEPASLLLERIRQERGANDAGKQTRRQKRAASPSLPY